MNCSLRRWRRRWCACISLFRELHHLATFAELSLAISLELCEFCLLAPCELPIPGFRVSTGQAVSHLRTFGSQMSRPRQVGNRSVGLSGRKKSVPKEVVSEERIWRELHCFPRQWESFLVVTHLRFEECPFHVRQGAVRRYGDFFSKLSLGRVLLPVRR